MRSVISVFWLLLLLLRLLGIGTLGALAAAGAAPTEIAWKTGLPVDAVSMLLEISGARMAAV